MPGHSRRREAPRLLPPQDAVVRHHDEETPLPEAAAAYATLVRLAGAVHRQGYARGLSVEGLARLALSTVHGLSLLLIEGIMETKARGSDDPDAVRQVVFGLTKLLRAGASGPRAGRDPR